MVYIHEPLFDVRMHSRIIADTEGELREFGEMLGLNQDWIKTEPRLHFEIYSTKLKLALSHNEIRYLTLAEFEEYL
jgi:hypothetical protein